MARGLFGVAAVAAVPWLVLVEVASGAVRIALIVLGLGMVVLFAGLGALLSAREARDRRSSGLPEPSRKLFALAQTVVLALALTCGLTIGFVAPPAPLAVAAGALVVLVEAGVMFWWLREQPSQWPTS